VVFSEKGEEEEEGGEPACIERNSKEGRDNHTTLTFMFIRNRALRVSFGFAKSLVLLLVVHLLRSAVWNCIVTVLALVPCVEIEFDRS